MIVSGPHPKYVSSEEGSKDPQIQTLGQFLDARIAQAKADLETACNTKARAETLQMLNYSVAEVRSLTYY